MLFVIIPINMHKWV